MFVTVGSLLDDIGVLSFFWYIFVSCMMSIYVKMISTMKTSNHLGSPFFSLVKAPLTAAWLQVWAGRFDTLFGL